MSDEMLTEHAKEMQRQTEQMRAEKEAEIQALIDVVTEAVVARLEKKPTSKKEK